MKALWIYIVFLAFSGGVWLDLPLVVAITGIFGLTTKQAFVLGLIAGLGVDVLTGRLLGLSAMVLVGLQVVIYLIKEQLALKSVFYLAVSMFFTAGIYAILWAPPINVWRVMGDVLLAVGMYWGLRIKTTPRDVYLK